MAVNKNIMCKFYKWSKEDTLNFIEEWIFFFKKNISTHIFTIAHIAQILSTPQKVGLDDILENMMLWTWVYFVFTESLPLLRVER